MEKYAYFFSIKFHDNLCYRCSKTKKMIIIGSLTFLITVIVALSISLPLTLRNRGEDTNNSSDTTARSTKLVHTTMITGMYTLYLVQKK
jgi:hypothetical protein